MRKIFITLFTCLFLLVGNSYAQLTVTMSSATDVEVKTPPTQVTIDVNVNGFTNLLGVQYSINFDSTVLKYVNATNFTGTLPGLNASAVSGPNGVGVKNGQMTFSWFDQAGTGKTLPSGTRLFSIVFDAIGADCKVSDIVTSNVPRIIEIVDNNFNPINLVNVKGTVSMKCGGGPVDPCPNPACANAGNLMLIAPTINAKPGETVCIPITVKNFRAIQSGQGSITWNTSLLTFTEFKVPSTGGIPMFDSGINANNVATGQLGFLWSNPDPANPLTLADNTKIIDVCFKVTGAVGQTACVLLGLGTIPSEWTNNSGEVATCFTYGKINIVDTVKNPVVIKAGSGSGEKGTTVCIDVTVDNFTDVLGLKSRFSWDPTQLEFLSTGMYSLDGMNSSNFNSGPIPSSFFDFLWTNPAPITKTNGSKIFQICFKLLACEVIAAINVPGPTEVIIQGPSGPAETLNSTVAGAITIGTCGDPGPICNLGATTNVTCNGRSDGSVALTVIGGAADCTCLWKNAAGTVVKPSGLVSAGCNLVGVPAGTYTYEVSCGGVIKCSGTSTVTEPTVINIPIVGNVTNVGCGQKGSINLSNVSGGTPPYAYAWSSPVGNPSFPTNLDAGQYTVTVTDSKSCTATATFTVGSTQTDLTVSGVGTNVKCKNGTDGSILLTIAGGCPTYNIAWSGGLSGPNPQGVKAGTYTATVTDGSVPAQSKTWSVTITEPTTALNVVTSNIVGSQAALSVGSITVTITGGTPNYNSVWTGPSAVAGGITTGTYTASGLKPGVYSVTVTDSNGCTAVLSSIVVPVLPDTLDTIAPAIGKIEVTSDFNGFGVACFGDKTGVIKVTLSKGTYPVDAELKSGAQSIQKKTVTNGDILFTDLVAGTYTVEVKNPKGTVVSTAIEVKQPTKLAATVKVNCTDKNASTGSIELNMNNTGTAPYGFQWLGLSDLDNLVENLAKDVYNVTITDANGCSTKLTNIEVKECSIPGGPCYTATTIITPNGDGFNDLFVINCIDNNPADLSVFDRWGRLVYSQNNYDNTWQGVNNSGTNLTESGYMWVLTVNFGQGKKEVYKGTVTILGNK